MRSTLALAALLAVVSVVVSTSRVAGQGAQTVAIDMDVTGNDDSTVGTIENCAEMSQVGDTFTFDLVIQGVDPAVRINGYQFDIDYDPSVIEIISVVDADAPGSTPPDNVSMISRINSSGGPGFIRLSDLTPDTDGSFTVAVADGTLNPPPPNNHEHGDGVLARVTAKAVGTGISPLTIPGPRGGQDGVPHKTVVAASGASAGLPMPLGSVLSAAVSVGTVCEPPPSPTPGADGSATGPGTPSTSTGADGTEPTDTPAGDGTETDATAGPGTPVLGGTPLSDATADADGAGGEAPDAEGDNDDGLGAAAWAGIASGIIAAALATSGAAWFVIRRRKARTE